MFFLAQVNASNFSDKQHVSGSDFHSYQAFTLFFDCVILVTSHIDQILFLEIM